MAIRFRRSIKLGAWAVMPLTRRFGNGWPMRVLFGLLLLLVGAAYAQHPCLDGEGRIVTSKWTCSDLGLHRAPDAVARAPSSRNCLDPQTILSLEMDTKSTGIDSAERQVRVANYSRARACQPLLSETQKEAIRGREERARESAAAARHARARQIGIAAGLDAANAAQNAAARNAIDARTGQVLPGVAGGVIDPRNGTFHQDVGGGYVNSRTGQFSPKH